MTQLIVDSILFFFIQDCINVLDSQFPNSNRVKRLKGMKAEAAGRFVSCTFLLFSSGISLKII